METAEPYVLIRMQNKIKKYFTRFDGVVFVSAFILALLVHLYMFTHKFLNHDDIDGLYSACEFGLSSGRWLLQAASGLTGHFSSSWLNGLAGSLFLAFSAMLMMKMFKIRHYLPAMLGTVCLVAFPTVASTYAYMFSSAPYLLAMVLAVIGAYLIRSEKLGPMITGSCMLALSMGCYQAYFCLAAALLVVLLIMDVCENRWKGGWKKFLITALKYLGFLFLGIVLYYAVLQFLLWYTGTELTTYQGISEMGRLTLKTLCERVKWAYICFGCFFFNTWQGIFHGFFPAFACICMAVNLGMVVVCVIRKRLYRQGLMMLFLILLILIFPLASNLIFVMAGQSFVHLLMVYPLVLTLVLPCIAIDRMNISGIKNKMLAKTGAPVLMAGLILLELICGYECVLITNRAYFCMDMTYENVFAYFNRLTAKIELTDGFTQESQVAIIGNASMDSFVPETNMTGFGSPGNGLLNVYSRARYLAYFLGVHYKDVTLEQEEQLRQTAAFQQMPCYPDEGSIRNINGIITVKMEE
ncbi:MAG: hypothetical protein DBX52_00935 [Clostridiales bacterium]|nr:MAG: hypothetical protein DBX52_00935 [Clostridiales bacterium]